MAVNWDRVRLVAVAEGVGVGEALRVREGRRLWEGDVVGDAEGGLGVVDGVGERLPLGDGVAEGVRLLEKEPVGTVGLQETEAEVEGLGDLMAVRVVVQLVVGDGARECDTLVVEVAVVEGDSVLVHVVLLGLGVFEGAVAVVVKVRVDWRVVLREGLQVGVWEAEAGEGVGPVCEAVPVEAVRESEGLVLRLALGLHEGDLAVGVLVTVGVALEQESVAERVRVGAEVAVGLGDAVHVGLRLPQGLAVPEWLGVGLPDAAAVELTDVLREAVAVALAASEVLEVRDRVGEEVVEEVAERVRLGELVEDMVKEGVWVVLWEAVEGVHDADGVSDEEEVCGGVHVPEGLRLHVTVDRDSEPGVGLEEALRVGVFCADGVGEADGVGVAEQEGVEAVQVATEALRDWLRETEADTVPLLLRLSRGVQL